MYTPTHAHTHTQWSLNGLDIAQEKISVLQDIAVDTIQNETETLKAEINRH